MSEYRKLLKKSKNYQIDNNGYFYDIERDPFFTKKRIVIGTIIAVILLIIIFNLVVYFCVKLPNEDIQTLKNDFDNIKNYDEYSIW